MNSRRPTPNQAASSASADAGSRQRVFLSWRAGQNLDPLTVRRQELRAMDPRDAAASPDTLRLTVDGDVFDVVHDPTQRGTYHYTRRTGPAPGYGFTSRRSDHARSTTAEHVKAIRSFLARVDPVTGYIDPDDDGEDDTLDH